MRRNRTLLEVFAGKRMFPNPLRVHLLENKVDQRKEEGLHTLRYETEQKKSEATCKEGKRDGLYMWWYENELKQSESNYKDGELDGPYTMWNEHGNIIEQITYKKIRVEMP